MGTKENTSETGVHRAMRVHTSDPRPAALGLVELGGGWDPLRDKREAEVGFCASAVMETYSKGWKRADVTLYSRVIFSTMEALDGDFYTRLLDYQLTGNILS